MTLVYPPDDFEAFLTAILETWLNRAPEWAITPATSDWFGAEGPRKTVSADRAAALRVANGVKSLAGEEAWTVLGRAFRHADRGKEAVLAEFIRTCVRHGTSTLDRLTDPPVAETLRRARAVLCEAHRFLGLVRFQEVAGGGYYGGYSPDHDVTGMLVGHFEKRLARYDWMLHDVGRGKAWVCRDGVGEALRGVRLEGTGHREPSERAVQDLWCRYFQTIAVPDRINPRAQRTRMPQKTWGHLVEKPGRNG